MLGDRTDVEFLAAVKPMGVANEADLLHDAERPVDRGRCGLGIDRAATLDELAAGDMTVGRLEDFNDQPALGRPAHAPAMEVLAQVVGTVGE